MVFFTFLRYASCYNFDIGVLSSTFAGVIILVRSVFILIFIPWLDHSKICSSRYRPVYNIFFLAFIIDVVFLGLD
ncbi:hypothetical protein [Bartonella koehlerae]|uniref:hypothetical protein n=1 Tax=Bartonella koehlerae TaxID=92181 RepID=UPI003CCF069D